MLAKIRAAEDLTNEKINEGGSQEDEKLQCRFHLHRVHRNLQRMSTQKLGNS